MITFPPVSPMLPTMDPATARREAILRMLKQPPMPVESPLGNIAKQGDAPQPGEAPKPYTLPTQNKRGR